MHVGFAERERPDPGRVGALWLREVQDALLEPGA